MADINPKSKSLRADDTIVFFSADVISFSRALLFLLSFIFYFLNNSTAAAIAAKGSTSLVNCPTGAVTPPITAPGALVIADPALPIAS